PVERVNVPGTSIDVVGLSRQGAGWSDVVAGRDAAEAAPTLHLTNQQISGAAIVRYRVKRKTRQREPATVLIRRNDGDLLFVRVALPAVVHLRGGLEEVPTVRHHWTATDPKVTQPQVRGSELEGDDPLSSDGTGVDLSPIGAGNQPVVALGVCK